MKILKASDFRPKYNHVESNLNMEITPDTAKDYYFLINATFISKEERDYFLDNYGEDELMQWNKELVSKSIRECNNIIENENDDIDAIRKLCSIYISRIRDIFIDDKSILKEEYNLLLKLFGKYGYFTLYNVTDYLGGECSPIEFFSPLENEIINDYSIFDKSLIYTYNEFRKEKYRYIYTGLIPFAKCLNYYELIDDIVKNIVYPALDNFYENSKYLDKMNMHYLNIIPKIVYIKDIFKEIDINYQFDDNRLKDKEYYQNIIDKQVN